MLGVKPISALEAVAIRQGSRRAQEGVTVSRWAQDGVCLDGRLCFPFRTVVTRLMYIQFGWSCFCPDNWAQSKTYSPESVFQSQNIISLIKKNCTCRDTRFLPSQACFVTLYLLKPSPQHCIFSNALTLGKLSYANRTLDCNAQFIYM